MQFNVIAQDRERGIREKAKRLSRQRDYGLGCHEKLVVVVLWAVEEGVYEGKKGCIFVRPEENSLLQYDQRG